MQLHFKQASKAKSEVRYTVVLMDGAGWHTNELADELDNLSLVIIPPLMLGIILLSVMYESKICVQEIG